MDGILDTLLNFVDNHPVMVVGGATVVTLAVGTYRIVRGYFDMLTNYYNRPYQFPRYDVFQINDKNDMPEKER